MEKQIKQLVDNGNALNENVAKLRSCLDPNNNISAKLSHLSKLVQDKRNWFDNYGADDYSYLAGQFRMAIEEFAEIYQKQTACTDNTNRKIAELVDRSIRLINVVHGHVMVLNEIKMCDKNREINDKLLLVEQALQNKEISEEKASKLVQKLRNSTDNVDIQKQLDIYKKQLNDNGVVTTETAELKSSSFDENGVQTVDELVKKTSDYNHLIEELTTSLTRPEMVDEKRDEIMRKMDEISALFDGTTYSSRVHFDRNKIEGQLTTLRTMIYGYYPTMSVTTNNIDEQVDNAINQCVDAFMYSGHEMFEAEGNAISIARNKLASQIETTEQLQENMPPKVCSVVTTLLNNDMSAVKNNTSFVNQYTGTAEQHVASAKQLESMQTRITNIEKGITV